MLFPKKTYSAMVALSLLAGGSRVARAEVIANPQANPEQVVPDVDAQLKARFGLTTEFAPSDLSILQNALAKEIEVRQQKVGKDKVSSDADYLFLNYANSVVQKALTAGQSTRTEIGAYMLGKRVLYGLIAENPATAAPVKSRWQMTRNRVLFFYGKFRTLAKFAGRVVFKDMAFSIPYLTDKAVRQATGKVQASREATLLPSPSDARSLIHSDELAAMTPNQIGGTDIGEGHAVWNTQRAMATGVDTWTRIEKFLELGASRSLSQKQGAPVTYTLDQARRVLFFDSIKTSATSPKADAKDAYGIKWKIKWGEETENEVVANRLYLKLGGKFTDIIYDVAQGIDQNVLILADPADAQAHASAPCDYPTTAPQLTQCLLASSYHFNVAPFIAEQGTITASNADQVLKHLPADAKGRCRKSALIGRNYVSFRESSLAIYPPDDVVVRGGPTPFSSLGSLEDRVARELMVFDFWIDNIDAKDDNNRSYLAKDFDGPGTGYTYLESQHDLGATFGGFLTMGQVDQLETGENFLTNRTIADPFGAFATLGQKLGLGGRLYFREPVLYFPNAWTKTTYADALWMAKKITALTQDDLAKIVSHTHWPDFVQAALVYKMTARKNQIALYFRLPVEPLRDASLNVRLTTPALREAAEQHYALVAGSIEAAMKRAGLLGKEFTDVLVSKGNLPLCEQTILMGLIQRQQNPAGLTRRIGRLYDQKQGDRGCEYGAKSPPSEFAQLFLQHI